MKKKLLYAGDTSLGTAAGYLGGILTHEKLPFDYIPSDQPIVPALTGAEYALYIISDYPVNSWRPGDFQTVLRAVKGGSGLLMIGGWESFHGAAGEYHDSPLAEALPVKMQSSDDRVQSRLPWVLQPTCEHPITAGLPFDQPPTVGGFNRITPKPDAKELLRAVALEIVSTGAGLTITTGPGESMLTVGSFGQGRTAALACDVAPHWVGTFVDWGAPRIVAQTGGAESVEVGCHYLTFFARLVRWCMGE
ncbi:MAG: hypothetical protein KAJ01_05310 [Candidatus Hydrogenedentes bacterium]|nr:hypothetical protein [Candidatus Hydrogenedentota bacterium]